MAKCHWSLWACCGFDSLRNLYSTLIYLSSVVVSVSYSHPHTALPCSLKGLTKTVKVNGA